MRYLTRERVIQLLIALGLVAFLVWMAREAGASEDDSEVQLGYASCSTWFQTASGTWQFLTRTLEYAGGNTVWMPSALSTELANANRTGIVHCGGIGRVAGVVNVDGGPIQVAAGQVWTKSFPAGFPPDRFGLEWRAATTENPIDFPQQLAWGWATWSGAQEALNWDQNGRRLAMWGQTEQAIRNANRTHPVGWLMISSPWAQRSLLNAFSSRELGPNRVYFYLHPKDEQALGGEILVLDGSFPATATLVPPTGTPGPSAIPTRTATSTAVPANTPGPMVPRAYLPWIIRQVIPPTPRFTLTPTRTNTPTHTATPVASPTPTSTPAPPADPSVPTWNNEQWAYGGCKWDNEWHPVSWYKWDRILFMTPEYIAAATPGGVTQEDVWCVVVAEKGGILNAGSTIQLGPNQRHHFRYWSGTQRGQFGFNFIANAR